MHLSAGDWGQVKALWAGDRNFLMTGACVPFEFEFPSIDRVVDEMRRDEQTRILSGTRADRRVSEDISERFRAMRIDEAIVSPFSIAHFELSRFSSPGKFLNGFEKRVLDPWRDALRAAGFTWDRCYPIVFISGIHCATNYHCDQSHVIAWQIHGTKQFCGLMDPDRWATREQCMRGLDDELLRPAELTTDDVLSYEMHPGDVLWNALLTPHWVDAGNEVAMSVNLSHGGLRLNGQLSAREQALEVFRAANPDDAPPLVKSRY